MIENLKRKHKNMKINFFGTNIYYEDFLLNSDKEILSSIEKCGDFFISKEKELIPKTFKLMKITKEFEKFTEKELYNFKLITDSLCGLAKEINLVISFLDINREILEHILLKIDQLTSAFDSKEFCDFFRENYKKQNSIIKHFLEHPGILRIFFQVVFLKEKCESFFKEIFKEKIYDDINKSKENYLIKDLIPSIVNEFEESFELSPLNYIENNSQNIETEINLKKSIKNNIGKIIKYLQLKSEFVNRHEETIFLEKNIKIKNYLNIKKLRIQSLTNYEKINLTLEDFKENIFLYDPVLEIKKRKPCYNMFDLWMVLIHTFLYLTNYYGLSSTSSFYSSSLGINPAYSGVLQAITPLTEIFTGFLVNWLTANNKYKLAYFLCLSFLLIGNVFYYHAESVKKINGAGLAFLIIGRMFIGAGGGRLMTRKYIAINIEIWAQSQYSAVFVLMSSLGETIGPGFSSILSFVPDTKLGITFMISYNIVAFIFIFIWGLVLFLFFIFFKGHSENSLENIKKIEYEEYLLDQRIQEEKEIYQNSDQNKKFIISSLPQVDLKKATFSNLEKLNSKYKNKNETPFLKAYFPNSITIFSLLCFIIFKMFQEAWFTELPKMAFFYYGHTPRDVGWYLLISTCYAVPVSLFVKTAKRYPDRYLLVGGFIIFIIATLIKINFTFNGVQNMYQYYVGSSILFCASLIGEATSIAILAKVISPTLKRGSLNAGLLSGTGDTVARALGNVSYTIFVSFGGQALYSFLWYIFAFVVILIFFAITIKFLPKLQKHTIIKICNFENKSKEIKK